MQSKKLSAFEAGVNTVAGFGISVVANMIVLPAFGYAVSIGDSLAIGVVFTAISFIRSYILRRIFNSLR